MKRQKRIEKKYVKTLILFTGQQRGTPAEKRPLGRPGRRWEDNIRMDLKEISISRKNWVDSLEDRDYWRALL